MSGSSNVVRATTLASTDTVAPTSPTLLSASTVATARARRSSGCAGRAATDDVEPGAAIEYEVRVNGVINEVIPGGTQTVAYTEVLGANTVTIVAVDRAGNASPPSNALTVVTNWAAGGCGI